MADLKSAFDTQFVESAMPEKDVFTEQRYAPRKIQELAGHEAEMLENLPYAVIEEFQKKRVKPLADISPEARRSLVAMGFIDDVLANGAQAHFELVLMPRLAIDTSTSPDAPRGQCYAARGSPRAHPPNMKSCAAPPPTQSKSWTQVAVVAVRKIDYWRRQRDVDPLVTACGQAGRVRSSA